MQTSLRDQLIGSWRLVDCRVDTGDGDERMPFGAAPRGRLLYTDGGFMSATIARRNRAPLSSPSLETAARVSDAEKSQAFDSYLSYTGRFEVDSNVVSHHVDLALIENTVGTVHMRTAELEDGRLLLSYAYRGRSGRAYTYRLTWERES